MAALSTQVLSNDGTVLAFAQVSSGGDTAEVGSGRDTFLVVNNGSAAPVDVVIDSDIVLNSGDDYPAKTVTVATGAVAYVPLLKDYLDADNPGRALFTTVPDAPAGVEAAVVRR